MSWTALLAVIEAEAGAEVRDRIEVRARELRGARITIPAPGRRAPPTDDQVQAALREARFNVADAARLLEVSVASVYRHLSRKLRPKPPPAPRLIR